MYLAPLNYDRFFKKVFSDLRIAKRFLEDFFDKTIESIELLPPRHRLTDEAMVVEFDYRCKIDGRFIIVDMQQWYKSDLAKRFYLYHCLNTALQLDGLSLKSVAWGDEKKKTTKDYSLIEPTITLIWMADDTFGTDENLLTFILMPDIALDFLKNEAFWEGGLNDTLVAERSRVLKVFSNKTRQLSFLWQNKLIYAFQKNIVKDKKYNKFVRWFHFAEKSRNIDNKKEDFQEFLNDEIFMEVMNRLDQSTLLDDDIQYITDFELFKKEYQITQDRLREELRDVVKEEVREEVKEEVREEVKEEVREEVKEEVREEVREELQGEFIEIGEHKSKLKIAEKCLLKKMTVEQTAEFVELSIEEVQKLAQNLSGRTT